MTRKSPPEQPAKNTFAATMRRMLGNALSHQSCQSTGLLKPYQPTKLIVSLDYPKVACLTRGSAGTLITGDACHQDATVPSAHGIFTTVDGLKLFPQAYVHSIVAPVIRCRFVRIYTSLHKATSSLLLPLPMMYECTFQTCFKKLYTLLS